MKECRVIEAMLAEYAEGALSATDRERVAAHLAACSPCRAGAEELRGFLGSRPAAPDVSGAYWATVLPRVRARIDARGAFELPAFATRALFPALGALLLVAMSLTILPREPRGAAADASAILGSVPEEDLATAADDHDAQSILVFPAELPGGLLTEADAASLLDEIVSGDTVSNFYAYVDAAAAVADLPEEDQLLLISMLQNE